MSERDELLAMVHDRLDGVLSAEDIARLDAALASDPDLAHEAAELERLRELMRAVPRPAAPAGLRDTVMRRVAATDAAPQPAPVLRLFQRPWVRAAAAALLLAVTAPFWLPSGGPSETPVATLDEAALEAEGAEGLDDRGPVRTTYSRRAEEEQEAEPAPTTALPGKAARRPLESAGATTVAQRERRAPQPTPPASPEDPELGIGGGGGGARAADPADPADPAGGPPPRKVAGGPNPPSETAFGGRAGAPAEPESDASDDGGVAGAVPASKTRSKEPSGREPGVAHGEPVVEQTAERTPKAPSDAARDRPRVRYVAFEDATAAEAYVARLRVAVDERRRQTAGAGNDDAAGAGPRAPGGPATGGGAVAVGTRSLRSATSVARTVGEPTILARLVVPAPVAVAEADAAEKKAEPVFALPERLAKDGVWDADLGAEIIARAEALERSRKTSASDDPVGAETPTPRAEADEAPSRADRPTRRARGSDLERGRADDAETADAQQGDAGDREPRGGTSDEERLGVNDGYAGKKRGAKAAIADGLIDARTDGPVEIVVIVVPPGTLSRDGAQPGNSSR